MRAESFTDFLDAYGREFPPSVTFREGEDFRQWQRRFREVIESLRGPMPERVEPKAEVIESVEADDHVRHVLRIPVSRISATFAYLLLPRGMAAGEKRAALLCLHGHAKYGIDSICGVREAGEDDEPRRAYALQAVRAGYAVLAPAWWGWAWRDGHLEAVKDRDKCNAIQMAASMYGLNVVDLHVQDGQAALDVLASRPEVDARRIGCIGNSYGGRTTMWLTIHDPRIAACVPSGCMNTFRERSLKLSSCGIQYPFGLLQFGDVPELFSLIAPRPMQLQAGAQDTLITPSDRDAMVYTVRRAYRALDAEPNFEHVLHPEGHMLRWDLAEPFLKRHLVAP